MRQPTLNSVKAFEAVARLGSVKAAALDLAVTASAISHHVRQLEQEIGKRLFIRRSNAIELTDEGRRLFEDVRPALRSIARATDAIRRDRKMVSMNVTAWFALHWLIPRLGDFKNRHPRIEIEMNAVRRPVVMDDSVELTISFARGGPPLSSAIELLSDFARPMAAPCFAIGAKGETRDIRSVPLIASTQDDWDWQVWARENNVEFSELRVAYRFDTDCAVIAACRAGLGVALVPSETGRLDCESGLLVAFGQYREQRFGSYWLTTAPKLQRSAEVFVNWLIKVAPGTRPEPAAGSGFCPSLLPNNQQNG